MSPSNPTSINIDVIQAVLFDVICKDLSTKSYSVQKNAIPEELINLLCERVNSEDGPHYKSAGIGRSVSQHKNQSVRRDKIAWIDDDMLIDQKWNLWTETLRTALNRQLFMGLTPIECHYARYEKGGFYKKHIDAFSGTDNRKISIVIFLNDAWKTADEGELMLYVGPDHDEKILVSPEIGTLVIFLSTEVPHEVLPTNGTRNSIAGWYR
ncbi:MAG: 2OG-Fe(II) oxygenase [Kordiimonadaceae bacterium]|jgi:SM-20-related protein|nr:2OG-Fe(II) oxygenase [Kordiimonadaceae bacterium]MBT6033063.1 2OG-Fe(II) oxygenase [Kordiimonadaceae bacterium]